jgi:hypothetical protein
MHLWERLALGGFALSVITLFAVASTLSPDVSGQGTHRQLGLPPCTMRVLWNLPCPACGMTTSWAHFVRGQWLASLQANIGGFLLALCASASILSCATAAVKGFAVSQRQLLAYVVGLLSVLAVALTQWCLRVFT